MKNRSRKQRKQRNQRGGEYTAKELVSELLTLKIYKEDDTFQRKALQLRENPAADFVLPFSAIITDPQLTTIQTILGQNPSIVINLNEYSMDIVPAASSFQSWLKLTGDDTSLTFASKLSELQPVEEFIGNLPYMKDIEQFLRIQANNEHFPPFETSALATITLQESKYYPLLIWPLLLVSGEPSAPTIIQ